jgi:CheY-like chemotaxis protein
MEGDALNDQRSVLIVDRSQETREVLHEALRRLGLRTLQAGRAQKGLELARRHRPDLIVLDLDVDNATAEQFATIPCDACDAKDNDNGADATCSPQSAPYQPRLVLLGSLRDLRERLPCGEFVSKPYHYGPLIRKIEELLVLHQV